MALIDNKKAYFDYDITQKYEAGMSKVCVGTENRIAEFFKMTRLELVGKIEEINKKQ